MPVIFGLQLVRRAFGLVVFELDGHGVLSRARFNRFKPHMHIYKLQYGNCILLSYQSFSLSIIVYLSIYLSFHLYTGIFDYICI